ncbi:MAG: phosphodiester glycosidase family protein [Sandaracinaceae bacterium]
MRRRPERLALLVPTALALALCVTDGHGLAQDGGEPPPRVEHTVHAEQRSDGEPYDLHRWRLPLAHTSIAIADARMGTRLSRYVRGDAVLAVNGGFYAPDRRPEGLVVEHGQEINPFLARIGGGIVSVADGVARLHDAEQELRLPDDVDFAIQCRPRLVVDGQNNIAPRSDLTAARTALCIREDGRVLDVYVARRDPSRGRAGPTLHSLAEVLVREGCESALNLDGGPSTGAAWRSARGVRSLRPRRGVRHAIVFSVR